MKLNCKGFVLLETLIVAVFIIGIFTFLYSSVIPLLGTYEDLTNKNNIDIVYKLYHIRKLLYEDDNYSEIVSNLYDEVTCSDFYNSSKCLELINSNYLDLNEGYQIIYASKIKTNASQKDNVKNIIASETFKKYIDNYSDDKDTIILLYDNKTDSVAHLAFTIK